MEISKNQDERSIRHREPKARQSMRLKAWIATALRASRWRKRVTARRRWRCGGRLM